MCRSTSNDSPYFMEPDYGADSRIWDDSLLQWGDYSEYLLGRYVRTNATSTRDFHLGPVSVEGPYIPAASHNPVVQTSHWEGQTAKGSSGYERSGATGSSDGPSHLSATSALPELTSNPVSAAGDRLPEAKMMTVGLPAILEKEERGPPSGRPIS